MNPRTAFDDDFTLQRLQKVWRSVLLFHLIFTLVWFSVLSSALPPADALTWLLPAAAVNAYVLVLLRKALNKNYHPAAKILLPHLGWANWLTVLRGGLIGALGGFVFQAAPIAAEKSSWLAWTPGAVYSFAALLDYFDGYIARITKSETRLGEWLDTKIDALGLLVAPVLAIALGRLPIFYVAVSLAYYLFQFGVWYRKKTGRPAIKPDPHPAKRMIAGFQMGLVAIALFPIFSRPVMTIAALIFMIPLLCGFLRDWLVICGYVEVNHLQKTRWDHLIDFLIAGLLPVFLRVIIGVAGIFFFCRGVTDVLSGREIFSSMSLHLHQPYHLHKLLIATSVCLMAAFGIVTRIAALLISIFLAGTLTNWNSSPGLFFLFACAATLMMTGSGLLSIWHPEDTLLMEKQG